MSLDLLDAPIRLTWDFAEAGARPDSVRLPAIACRIKEAGVFFVTLQGRPLLSPHIADVVETLSGCQLMLTCHCSEDEVAALSCLPLTVCQILLDVTEVLSDKDGLDSDHVRNSVTALRSIGHNPVVALTPLRKNIGLIPDLVRLCGQLEVPKFKLPNAHIGDSFHGYSTDELPRWQDLDGFRSSWSELTCETDILPAMEIHDLFLWEIMTPGEQQNRSEYGGCQAGNSLGHVDLTGVVHPCAAWPQPLGRLPEQTLEDIWADRKRHEVVLRVADTPSGCDGCSDLNICFGGCRGLAEKLNATAGARDLMCSGPR